MRKKSKFLAINCQTNSANLGFNLITKYPKSDFICIDEPELNQLCSKVFLSFSFISFNKKYSCGKISTEKLKRLIKNEIILCKVENIDRYKRKLATCYKNKLNINSWLVRNGYALAYIKYSKKYILQEKEAKRDQLGIWQGTFENPWDWRKNVKNK